MSSVTGKLEESMGEERPMEEGKSVFVVLKISVEETGSSVGD